MINLQKYKPAPIGNHTNRLLTKWVLTKYPSVEAAAGYIGISPLTLLNAMHGRGMQTGTVNKILIVTGYTYEELFMPTTTVQDARSATQ